MRTFERLEPEPVIRTIGSLRVRMEARFPDRQIIKLAEELDQLARDTVSVTDDSRARLRWVRAVANVLMVAVGVVTVGALVLVGRSTLNHGPERGFEWLPLVESAVNDLVYAGIALFFLNALPTRLERGRLLRILHRLRSLAHIVDMHQLTKDPERLRTGFQPTEASPAFDMDRDQLEQYLEYCSEMLSLIGKVAAVCAESSDDSVVLDTVSTVEHLTTGLSNKIWQKISILPR